MVPPAQPRARGRVVNPAAGPGTPLLQADLGALPLVDGGFDTAAADLPYGMLMGRPDQNERVYRAALGEARRVVAPRGRFVAITAAWRLFDATLADHQRAWTVERTVRVS